MISRTIRRAARTPAARTPVTRGPVAALLVAAALAAASGCGIRATSVPVDAGAAPSRVSCTTPSEDPGPGAPPASPSGSPSAPGSSSADASASPGAEASGKPAAQRAVEVYLVCRSEVVPRTRTAGFRDDDPEAAARRLVGLLRAGPTREEGGAGFTTDVPPDLQVRGPRSGDPEDAWRLSREPDELPSFALAQLVCTFSASLADGGPVLLGGPDDDRVLSYPCTQELRTRPEAGLTAGASV
ncbi:hypothetical protein [Streptomyces sp. HB2AG]|uniref:hypothetical protein n=1 Tax=Streptomyces sp. HB2AG TaxID=2983400 RepID=UPI0022AA479E|nr:hypothetical protein [Streptomyces sp. HB2AG]MCZ2527256.1 hypothetical protein [Streptomyces sp. HB2AG]